MTFGLLDIPIVLDTTDFTPDFINGFWIEEEDDPYETVNLIGHLMPHQPFTFGGKQRVIKEYYPGDSEPATQVLGSQESDMTIRGRLYDKRYRNIDTPYGMAISTEIQKRIDAIRIRGNLCRFHMGEWERFGYIEETNWNLKRLSDIQYELKLSIIGFSRPSNAKFVQEKKEIPFDINDDLIEQANDFNSTYSNVPSTVNLTIAELLEAGIGAVAGAISTLTNFVDSIITTVEDVEKSITRAQGLIKYCQGKLNSYKKIVGAYNAFDTDQALSGKYENAKFYAGAMAGAASLSALLNKYRTQFNSLETSLPLARYTVKEGDTLQKISVKYYKTADNWKEIFDYNALRNTDLESGTILEIPRV